jgi:hypothetical protein
MVFDATGLRRKEWQSQMEQLGLRFAHGVGPCAKGNHTLRTLGGNCMQCDPATIAFANRHYDEGFVYIAYSLEKILLKVGVAKSVQSRNKSLNNLAYAGANDWKTLQSVKVRRAGEIEFAIHSDLAKHNLAEKYLRNGELVVCREVFRCDIHTASVSFEEHTGTPCKANQEVLQRFLNDYPDRSSDIFTDVDLSGDDEREADETPQWILNFRSDVKTETNTEADFDLSDDDDNGELTPRWIFDHQLDGKTNDDVSDDDDDDGDETPQWILDYQSDGKANDDVRDDDGDETPQWIIDIRDTPQWITHLRSRIRRRRNRR